MSLARGRSMQILMLALAIITIAQSASPDDVVPETRDKTSETSGIVTSLPAGALKLDANGRVTQAEFVEYFEKKHASELTDITTKAEYDKYLNHLWILSLSMNNSPSEETLGPRHFKYAAIQAGAFYFNGHSAPSMPPAASETRDMKMADRDWAKVLKDKDGRVTRQKFTKFFKHKHSKQVNRKEEYGKFVDALFELALEMMKPASESTMGFFTIGEHCFKTTAVIAEQYYVQGRMPKYIKHPIVPAAPPAPSSNEFAHPVGHPYNEVPKQLELVTAL